MKRNQKFLTAFLAAAITFGGLYAFAGQKYFAKMGSRHCHYAERRHHMHEHDWYREGERPTVSPDSVKVQ